MWKFLVLALALVAFVGCDRAGLKEFNEGVAFMEINVNEAERLFKLAIEKDSLFAEAHLNLGLIYLQKEWAEGTRLESAKAIKLFELTKSVNPEIAKTSMWKTNTAVAYGNYGAAVLTILGDLLTNNDENLDSIKLARRMLDTAQNYLNFALKYDPSYVNAQVGLKKIPPMMAQLDQGIALTEQALAVEASKAAILKSFQDWTPAVPGEAPASEDSYMTESQ
jgi:tetratricopeptide (TPR) repeat protein